MAEDTTRLIIQVETLLKGLDKTLRGLGQVEAQLKKVASIKVGATGSTSAFDRATQSAKRLENQQRRLAIQSQELDNRQKRAEQSTARLAQAQSRLNTSQERLNKSSQQTATFLGLTNKQLIGMGNAARSIGQGLVTFGTIVTTAVTVPLTALGAASVNAAVQMDSLKRGLTAIVGSSAEASRQLARLATLAKLPGIGFEEAIQGSIRLQAVGFSARDAERNLREFANAVALTGGGRDELARVTVQLGQLAAKGKVLSQDLRPIIEAAPAVGRALKEAFGTVNADDIAELTTNSREFLDVLVGQLERLPRAAAGAKNSFENFRDTVFRAAAAVGEALLPALIQLAEVAGPIISGLAKVFSELPKPIQAMIVSLAAIVAIAGPLTLIVGGLVLGLGRLVVGIVQFNAQLPATAVGLFGLATGANAATGAMAILQVTLIATGIGLAGILGTIGLVGIALTAFSKITEGVVEVTQEQISAHDDQIASLKTQIKFLNELKVGVRRTADEQDQLNQIYGLLNQSAAQRIDGIDNETERLAAQRAELEKLLQVRLQEREQDLATIAANLVNATARAAANETEIKSISDRIAANTRLIETLQAGGKATEEDAKVQHAFNVLFEDSAVVIRALQTENQQLLKSKKGLRDETRKLTKQEEEWGALLKVAGVNSEEAARRILLMAQRMGLFSESVDEALPRIKEFIGLTKEAASAGKTFNDIVREQERELLAAGEAADKEQKRRRGQIASAAAVARETTKGFQQAFDLFKRFVAAQPSLQDDLRREAEITGKTIKELITSALGGTTKDRGEALRNAQEQLNDALDRVQQAAAEQTIAREKAKTDDLLAINEFRFRRELISFKQFVVQRARLERDQIQGEIDRQKKIAELAAGEADRAAVRAGATAGVERTKARADEQRAIAEMTKAEAKILELQSDQRQVLADTANDLTQFAEDRQRRFRELSRELDEITGKEGEAERSAISERFAEDLRTLRNEIKAAGIDLVRAQAQGDKAGAQMAAATLDQLRGQVETITNAKKQLNALVEVREAHEEIRRAEEAQRNLERDLIIGVEFRGLAEEDAIQKRLEGEAKVREVIQQQQVRLEILAATLKKAGLEIPLALSEAIEQFRVQSQGLGELPFVEQFRLAQQEFDRLNDLRIRKIQEVERAVAHRDISELQGRIAIRAANGQYVGDLERQVAILEDIARRSKDQGLLQQAADARQLAIETRNATTEVADLSRELQSAAIDSLRNAFAGMGRSLIDIARGATTAKEALLDMLDQVAGRLTDIAFDRLAEKIFGGLLGGAPQVPAGDLAGAATAGVSAGAGAGLQAAAATAGAALTTGGATAGAAMSTGGVTAGASITTAGAAFLAAVSAAAAAFAAAVTAGAGAQVLGGLGSAAAGAATGLFPAVPGGLIHIVEGGHPEAVLSTDPKYAARQVSILRQYLEKTRGLWGRIPQFEAGGWASASQMESQMLSSLSQNRGFRAPTPSADMQLATPSVSFRNLNFIDRDSLFRGYLRSAEGTRDVLNTISENSEEVGRRVGIR